MNKESLLLISENDPYSASSEKENVQKFIAKIADELDDEMSDIES